MYWPPARAPEFATFFIAAFARFRWSGCARVKQLFRTPIEKLGDSGRLTQLRSRITPFMLRRTKGEVATELPDRIESVSSIELSGKQADLYETIRLSTEKPCAMRSTTKAWPARRSRFSTRRSSCARSAATRAWCRWRRPSSNT